MNEIPRLISQYFYTVISIFTFCILYFDIFDFRTTIPLSKKAKKQVDNDPIWFSFLCDLYISKNDPDNNQRINSSLKHIQKIVKPHFSLFGGDLVDNCINKRIPFFVKQKLEDWEIYKEMISNSGIPSNKIIEVFGEHDLFNLDEIKYDSYPITHTNINFNEFNIYSRIINETGIVAWNPGTPPFGPSVMSYIRTIKRQMLDALENELEKIKNKTKTIFVLVHYPYDYLFSISRSSKTKSTYHQLLQRYNVKAVLTGHSHPKKIESKHYGKNHLEITSNSTWNSNGYTLFTLDNDNLAVHYIDSFNIKPAVVTFPTPSIYANEILHEGIYKIRVLSFGNYSKKFNIDCDFEKETKSLEYEKNINNSTALYSYSTYFDKGIHKIHFTGDINTSFEFAVGIEYGPFYEKIKRYFIPHNFFFAISICIVQEILLLYGIFVPSSHLLYDLNQWIRDKNNESKWLYCFVLGPALTGYRLKYLPYWIQIIIVITIFWTFSMPYSFFYINDSLSFVWLYGIVVNGKFCFDIFCIYYGYIYLIGPLSVIQTSFSMFIDPKRTIYFIDGIIMFLQIFFTEFGWWYFGAQFHKTFSYFSFPFTIIPLVLFSIFFIMKKFEKYIVFPDSYPIGEIRELSSTISDSLEYEDPNEFQKKHS